MKQNLITDVIQGMLPRIDTNDSIIYSKEF